MTTAIEVLLALAVGAATLTALRRPRLRDPRLDRDWSDDTPAPYDAPAEATPFDMPGHFGAENADSYRRMLDDDRPPQL